MSLKIITAPTSEPISLEDAKAHLRVDGDDDDALIAALIVSAREAAEHITGRALILQTLELALDEFHDHRGHYGRHAYRINLPRPPLVSITSITYVDTDGDTQTLTTSDYLLDDHSEPARIVPAYGTCWPATRCQPNAVLIRYQAGYANAEAVPQQIKNWMLLKIGTLYENREGVVAGVSIAEVPQVDRLLDACRVWSV